MSNAMSHSALAVWEGDKRGCMGGEEREYFCMLYEARRHMPFELGCLLSQSSWVDRLVFASARPPTPKATPFSPNQHSSNGLGNCLAVHGLSSECVCVGSVCTQ